MIRSHAFLAALPERRRALLITSFALAGALTVFLFQNAIWLAFRDLWLWQNYHYGNDVFKKRFCAALLPVPFVFVLWLGALEARHGRFALRFSPIAAGWSVIAYAGIFALTHWPDGMFIALAFGVLAGLFAFLPFLPWLRVAVQHKRLGMVALAGGSAALCYYLLMGHYASHVVLDWTAEATSRAIALVGIDAVVAENMDFPLAYNMITPHFRIILAPFCGGLEGIFLFIFMLSVVAILDWEKFSRHRLSLIYAAGVLVMFTVNILRITALFSLGYLAYHPQTQSWASGLRGAPVTLFHSYVGWGLDLLVFCVFLLILYPKRRPVTP